MGGQQSINNKNTLSDMPPSYSLKDDDLSRLSEYLLNVENAINYNELCQIFDALICESMMDRRPQIFNNHPNIIVCNDLYRELRNFKSSNNVLNKLKNSLVESAYYILIESEKKYKVKYNIDKVPLS